MPDRPRVGKITFDAMRREMQNASDYLRGNAPRNELGDAVDAFQEVYWRGKPIWVSPEELKRVPASAVLQVLDSWPEDKEIQRAIQNRATVVSVKLKL